MNSPIENLLDAVSAPDRTLMRMRVRGETEAWYIRKGVEAATGREFVEWVRSDADGAEVVYDSAVVSSSVVLDWSTGASTLIYLLGG